MKVSGFAHKIASASGIGRLMEDLAAASADSRDISMLGGGNPAHIPAVQKYFRNSILKLLADGRKFELAVGNPESTQN